MPLPRPSAFLLLIPLVDNVINHAFCLPSILFNRRYLGFDPAKDAELMPLLEQCMLGGPVPGWEVYDDDQVRHRQRTL